MPIHARLERTKVAERAWIYHLVLSGEIEKSMYVARIKKGGMTLVNYEISRDGNGRRILAALFYVHTLGHDLDQWVYFDLETGEQISEQSGGQPAIKLPTKRISDEKRQAADKLWWSVNRWGKQDNSGEGKRASDEQENS